MDDGEVTQHANLDVVGNQIPDRHRHGGLLEEGGAVDQRFVGIGAVKILRQDFVEPFDVAILHRSDIVAVEDGEFVDVFAHAFAPFWFRTK